MKVSLVTDWILVTGQPGCGKTTAVKKMVELLQRHDVCCSGFYTDEVLGPDGKRIGFDVVTVPDGERGTLSRKNGPKGWPKTGAYCVDVESFEKLALPTMRVPEEKTHPKLVYILDEIGRMELHSSQFQDYVRKLLQNQVRLVGAVTAPRYGHRVPFCDEVTAEKGVQVHNLKKSNRDNVVEALLKTMESSWLADRNG